MIAVAVVSAIVNLKGTRARGYAGLFLKVFAFPGLIVMLACTERHIERCVHPFFRSWEPSRRIPPICCTSRCRSKRRLNRTGFGPIIVGGAAAVKTCLGRR